MSSDNDDFDFMAYMKGPSCIQGLTGSDIIAGCQGHNISFAYGRDTSDKYKLLDPILQARVAFWLRDKAFSLKDIKMECKSNGLAVTGNKKVLCLRLALKKLPDNVETSTFEGYTITKCSPNKQGGKRIKTGGAEYASRSNSSAAATKSNDKKQLAKKQPAKKVKKVVKHQTKKTSTKKEAPTVLTDTNCNKCKVEDGFINKCEGSGCNKATVACECNDYCNDGIYKIGVSHCGCCERAYCFSCRKRYAGDCTSCQMMCE